MAGERFDEGLQLNLGAFLNSSPDCILVCDFHSLRYLYVNQTTCEMAGYSREELLGMTSVELTRQSAAELREIYDRARQAQELGYTDVPRLMADKDQARRGWWEAHFRYQVIDDREVVVIVSREVSRRILAERAAIRAKKIIAALSAVNEAIIRLSSPEKLFQAVCDAAIDSGGLSSAALLMPVPGSDLMKPKAVAGFGREVLEKTVMSIDPDKPEGRGLTGIAFRTRKPSVSNDYFKDRRTGPWHQQMRCETRLKAAASVPIVQNGQSVGTLHLTSRERNAFDDEIIGVLVRMADNIAFAMQNFERERERSEAEDRAHYLATHCSLTGLPNRNLLSDLLDRTIESIVHTGHNPAIMFVDLDNFKQINDTWGHDIGDRVLEKTAGRLSGALREHDVLARLGGDEFVVLVQNIDRREQAERVVEKLLAAVQKPVVVDGEALMVTLSIGVALYPDHGDDRRTLMKAADVAMYQAKEKGRNTWAIAGDVAPCDSP